MIVLDCGLRGLVGGEDLLADLGDIDLLFRQVMTFASPLLRVLLASRSPALRIEVGIGPQRFNLFQGPGVGTVVALVERFAGVVSGVGGGVRSGVPQGVQISVLAEPDGVAARIAVGVRSGSSAAAENAAVACSG